MVEPRGERPGSASAIPPSSSPPSRHPFSWLHLGIGGPKPREDLQPGVARSPTRAVARPTPAWSSRRAPAARLPAPRRAGLSSPGAGVTQPVCLLPAALSQPVLSSSNSSRLYLVIFLSKWSFTSFLQGIETPFQTRGGGGEATEIEPEKRSRDNPAARFPFPGQCSPARPCPSRVRPGFRLKPRIGS